MTKLETIKPLYQQVYDRVRELILKGELKAGEKININFLVEKYDISRTPLREALRQLEVEGILVQKKTGIYVIELSEEDFKQLYECRLLLEKEIMKLAVNNITKRELQELRIILNKFNEIDKLPMEEQKIKNILLNTEFHNKITDSVPNKRLIELIKEIQSFSLIYRVNILRNYKRSQDINKEHNEIYQALLERDEDKVIYCIEKHLKNDFQRGLNAISE